MANLLITRTCAEHVAHGGSVDLTCFDEATLQYLAVLMEFAPVENIIPLAREWFDQEDYDHASVTFADIEGEEFFISFTA
jgi:hypothetical protein